MASEIGLAEIIQLGQDLTSLKLYVVSVTALWVYDYFLTLEDELRYAWKTESVLIFGLFLLTRYLPVLFQVWVAVMLLYPGYTSEMCKKTAFVQVVYYTFIAMFAQIVLAQRTYAITGKNKRVAGILYAISAGQFCVGAYIFIWAALHPGGIFTIPLDSYHMCFVNTERASTLTQMVLSLVFDIAVFVLVVIQIRLIKSTCPGINVPKIINTFNRDTEIYFVLITTSHFLIVVMLVAARPGLRTIPILGNGVFIPVMICRMIISLKKVASSERPPCMNVELSAGLPTDPQDTDSSHLAPTRTIQLSVFRK